MCTPSSPAALWAASSRPPGPGDTFCASVLNFVLEHGIEGLTRPDLDRMLRFANAAAYLVTTKKGAIRSMPEPEQVEETMAKAYPNL